MSIDVALSTPVARSATPININQDIAVVLIGLTFAHRGFLPVFKKNMYLCPQNAMLWKNLRQQT